VPLLLLLGEVTPKTIAVTDPLRVATRITAAPMAVWVRVVAPLRWLVRQLSERISTLLGGEERAPENILKVDELRTLVEEVVASGELHAMERALIDNILAAGSTEVLQIMLPRTRVSFIDGGWPMDDIVAEVRRLRHRQLPVFTGSHDNVVGMLQAEDIARHLLDGHDPATLSLDDLLRPVVAVPTTKMVDELFGFFLQQEARAAVVVDEFGGVEGIVTLSDLIGFIFGHGASDEIPAEMFSELEDGAWEIDGALRMDRFDSLLRREGEPQRFTTVAGLMLNLLDERPRVGDSVIVDEATLTILAMDGLRIARIRVEPPDFASRPEDAGSDTAPDATRTRSERDSGDA
jgi:putative hemolysin